MTGYLIIIFLSTLLQVKGPVPILTAAGRGECTECHGGLIKNDVVHPQLESTCDICHTATGADHPAENIKGFDLSENLPGLCFNCHDDLGNHLESDASVHGPLRDALSCINCHNPHSSPNERLLIDGTNGLCMKCHDRTIRQDSTSVRNIKQIIARAKSIHPPIEAGGCVTCHNPHSGENRAMLIGVFIPDQYSDGSVGNFELCFLCHDSDLMDAETTEFATNFRNGKRNLHFLHLKGEKGRNCNMCHDVHGAVNQKLIIDRLQFGSWQMQFFFDSTADGGSCLTACHSEKKYARSAESF